MTRMSRRLGRPERRSRRMDCKITGCVVEEGRMARRNTSEASTPTHQHKGRLPRRRPTYGEGGTRVAIGHEGTDSLTPRAAATQPHDAWLGRDPSGHRPRGHRLVSTKGGCHAAARRMAREGNGAAAGGGVPRLVNTKCGCHAAARRMAREGIEPPTRGFSVRCSTN